MVATRKQIIEEYLALGFEVVVLAPLDSHLKSFQDLPGLRFHHLSQLDPGRMNPWRDLLFFRELRFYFRKYAPQLIFTFTVKPNIYGCRAAAQLGIPCIPTVTGLGYTYLVGGYRQRLLFSLYKWAFRSVEQVFFLNTGDKNLFQSKGIVVSERGQIVPGAGVDLDFFTSSPRKASSLFTFLFVGRLLEHKGLREYVQAAKILKNKGIDARFAIVGPLNGHNPSLIPAGEVARWISEGIVQYYGEVEDVRSYYQKCDVLVLPSYREGLSTVIVEAMAMERPVLAADVPGCSDAITSEWGWLVPPKNSEKLAEQMQACMDVHLERRWAMGQRARRHVEKYFSKKRAAQPYLSVADKMWRPRRQEAHLK